MSDEMKVQTKGLNKKFIFIAIALIVIGLVAALVLVPTSAKAKKVEEQLSLGAKYLSELDYEQAIAAYEAVIKIDPKCEEAYLALADIYISTGAFEKAEAILKQAEEAIGKDAQFLEEKRQEVSVDQKQAESTPVPSPTAIPTPELTATPTSTPTPTSEPSPTPSVIPTEDDSEKVKEVFDIQITMDGVDVIAENLKVSQDYNTNEIRVTISGILLQDSYTINKSTSDMDRLEYGWGVSMQSEKYVYEVATTSWVNEPGNESVRQLADMQHDIWEMGDGVFSAIGWAEIQHTSDSLTWIFTMPEGYELDIREIQKYEVSITEECDIIETREYSQSGNISVITPSPIPSPTELPTSTPSPTPTNTPSPTPTNTPSPTPTNTPSSPPTNTPTPKPTSTPVPTAKPTSTPTPVPTKAPAEELNIAETDASVFEYAVMQDGTVTIKGLQEGYPKEIRIPEKIEGYPVTSIGDYAFYECKDLSGIVIPDSVIHIGSGAFCWCSGLTSINIPDSVQDIGDSAFSTCSSLESIDIPNSVKSIGDGAFWNCSNLESVVLPKGITSIEKNLFWCCKKLKSIEIPDGVTNIGEDAFYSCSNLTNVKIPGSVTSIERDAFYLCKSLESIKIPDSVVTIGESAFYECRGLKSLEISNSITSIESFTFGSCTSLISVKIPDGVTHIGDNAFSYCDNLERVEIPNSVTSIGNSAFAGCKKLTSINIPDTVTSIGEKAFMYCQGLTNVRIPGSVKSVGDEVFSGCSKLSTINNKEYLVINKRLIWVSAVAQGRFVVPSDVTSIARYSVYNCEITSIEIPDTVTSMEKSAISTCFDLETIVTSKGSYAEQWAKDNGYGDILVTK